MKPTLIKEINKLLATLTKVLFLPFTRNNLVQQH